MAVKIFVIEDHSEYRETLCLTLNSNEGFSCCGRFSTIEAALTAQNTPDVILVDIGLPGTSGIEGIPKLKEKFPGASIVMLTVYDDNDSVFRSMVAGADGYLLKTTKPHKLISAIEDAAAGGCPASPTIARMVLNYFRKQIPPARKENNLSDREKEILSLIVESYNNEDIAKELFISIQTVRNHIRHIYEKLHVHSKSQAVAKALKENLL